MQRKSIAWILQFTAKLPNDEEKIRCLQENNHNSILTILKFCYHPGIKWLLPEGEPPYSPKNDPNSENLLYAEARRLYLFVEGGNNNLKQARREVLFIELLQSVGPDDAKLLVSIKDKKLPFDGLDSYIVKKAFPGLIDG